MKLTIFFVSVLILFNNVFCHNKNVVCYYGSWATYRPGNGASPVEKMDGTQCTHFIYTFVGLNLDGSVHIIDPWCDLPDGLDGYGKSIALKKQNPNLKVLLAMGGWNELEGKNYYTIVMNDPKLRANFVRSVLNFIIQYKFDGFDFDWEYPNQRGGKEQDRDGYVAALAELHKAFKPFNLILSSAVASAELSASLSYKISEISQYLDIINLMTYDLHGAWNNGNGYEPTGFNSPLYPRKNDPTPKLTVDSCLKYWLDNGADPSKIALGIPLYGRTFRLANPSNNQIGAPVSGPGQMGPYSREAGSINFNEVVEIRNSYEQHWDNDSLVPWMVKGDNWISYDNEQSVYLKAQYALEKNLGGVMVWSIDGDDLTGYSGQKFPLLKSINNALNGIPLPSTTTAITVPTTFDPMSSTTPSQDIICKHEGYIPDPTNCNLFYYCQDLGNGKFVSYSYNCPADLAFNPITDQCDYPKNVPGCEAR